MLFRSRTGPFLFHRHRNERIWSLPVHLVLLFIVLVSYCCCGRTLAVTTDLALGEWKLQLKSHQFDTIFPFQRQLAQVEEVCDRSANSKRKRVVSSLWPSPPRSYECHLSIFPNGTFALEGPSIPNNDQVKSDYLSAPINKNLEPNSGRLSVHGRWVAPNNPYCATDRFYQIIRLESFPRTQRLLGKSVERHANDGDSITDTTARKTLQRHQLVLYGRLAGHFQRRKRNQRSRSQAVGRITHGKIVQENLLIPFLDSNNKSTIFPSRWLHPRPIVASFVGQQVTTLSTEDEYDE